jgi:hypothetical protein
MVCCDLEPRMPRMGTDRNALWIRVSPQYPRSMNQRLRRKHAGRDAFHGVHRCMSSFEIKLDGGQPVPTCQGRFMGRTNLQRLDVNRGHEPLAARETLALPTRPLISALRTANGRLMERTDPQRDLGVNWSHEPGRARARVGGRGGFPSLRSARDPLVRMRRDLELIKSVAGRSNWGVPWCGSTRVIITQYLEPARVCGRCVGETHWLLEFQENSL